MIDLTTESLIRLHDVGNYIPSSRAGKRLGKAVAFRWALRGVRGTKLETLKVGGCRFTTVEAIQRFVAALNPNPASANKPPLRPNVTRRKHRQPAEHAAKALSNMGI
jgi:hypothetical protein